MTARRRPRGQARSSPRSGSDKPCRYPGGEPLTVTDEAAEALKAGGFVIVSRDDLKAILEGKASPDQWMQLAAVIGVSR